MRPMLDTEFDELEMLTLDMTCYSKPPNASVNGTAYHLD